MSNPFVLVVLLIASIPAAAAESEARVARVEASPTTTVVAGAPAFITTTNLLPELQSFLRQRKVEVDRLTADQMVGLMIDWYRFAPIDSGGGSSTTDTLVYRYGGWSEGCVTGFKLSLLRRSVERGAGDTAGRMAGITLMFEPSGGAKLVPFTATSSDWSSIEAFLGAVQGSPAFRQFETATPMAVMIETGGLR